MQAISGLMAVPPEAPPSVTRNNIAMAFRAVAAEYDDFRARYGGRLEPEWISLNEFITYRLRDDNLDVAHDEIQKFRVKLREESRPLPVRPTMVDVESQS